MVIPSVVCLLQVALGPFAFSDCGVQLIRYVQCFVDGDAVGFPIDDEPNNAIRIFDLTVCGRDIFRCDVKANHD